MIELLPIDDLKVARGVVDGFVMERYGEQVVRLECGRPTMSSQKISISHTVGFVAIMISGQRCGVDIERLDRRVEHISSRFATDDELKIAAFALSENPSLLIWCAKEAAYKWGERTGVDFLRDMCVTDADSDKLTLRFFDENLSLKYYIQNNLIIVHTL